MANTIQSEIAETNLTRVIPINSTEMNNERFHEAKRKEISDLQKRNVWKIMERRRIPDNANVLNGIFGLTIKDVDTCNEIEKDRYAVQGYKDREKDFLVHNSNTSKQVSTEIIASLAIILSFQIWSFDVSQAYVLSKDELTRDVYVTPPKEFFDHKKYVLKLRKPLYGLTDAGDYWHRTDRQHDIEDLKDGTYFQRSCTILQIEPR